MSTIFAYFQRDMIKWLRGRLNVFSTLAMPAAWLIFVGLALPTKFTDNYLNFITPGILVLTMLGAGLQGGSSIMFDKILGFLNKFLALPSPRESILIGKVLFITVRGLIQSTVILILAFLLGARFSAFWVIFAMYGVLFIFGILLSSAATTAALYITDHDTYAAVNIMVAMPLFFTSSALMPYSVMPGWLRVVASINPVSYAIDTCRSFQTGSVAWLELGIMTVLAILVLLFCMRCFRRYTV